MILFHIIFSKLEVRMSSVQYYVNILSSGFVSQTDIPNELIQLPEIRNIIYAYNWSAVPSRIMGWITLRKQYARYD